MALTTGTNNYSPTRYQVSQTSGYGNYTSIQSAINAAVAAGVPADIFIMEGTYNENLTMYAGINLTGWPSEGTVNTQSGNTNNVKIVGLIECVYSGTATISNVSFVSAGSGCIEVINSSGANTYLTIKNCQGYCSDTQFLNVQNTNSLVDIYNTNVYLTNACTNIEVVQGKVSCYYCNFISDHAAMTTNSHDGALGGSLSYNYCFSSVSVSCSVLLGGTFTGNYSTWTVTGASGNVIDLLTSTTNNLNFCTVNSGPNVAINVQGRTLNMLYCAINSSNTNAITGTGGTLNYSGVTFLNSSTITVTTQNPRAWPTLQGGTGLTSYTTGQTLYASATNVLSKLAIGSTGQVLTVVGGLPAWSNPSSTGLPWIDQGTNITAAVNTGYFVTASCTITLPTAPSQGTIVAFQVISTGSITFVTTAASGASIQIGNSSSSTSRSATNTGNGDALYLVYRTADTKWYSTETTGNWSLT